MFIHVFLALLYKLYLIYLSEDYFLLSTFVREKQVNGVDFATKSQGSA